MLNKIIGITGCVLGIAGCVANVIANNKIKRVSIDMANHVQYMHTDEQSSINSIENRIASFDKRIDDISKELNKTETSMNHICEKIDETTVRIDNIVNHINETNKIIDNRFNGVASDIININNWGKTVNCAIENLEMNVSKKEFKPVIKSMLDERRNVAAEASIPTEETPVAVATETPVETEIKTEAATTEATPNSNNKKKSNKR